jgi:hypothetical protein
MTRYTVVWDEHDERPFIAVWVGAGPAIRSLLTETANWIDRYLAVDPDQLGVVESESNERVVTIPTSSPLVNVSVAFQVFPADRQVRVQRIVFRR